MNNNLRSSGIDIIGNIPWGTHICHIYKSKKDFADVGAPYIKTGLMNNELCIWIYSQNTSYEEIRDIIGVYINNIDRYIESGQLMIIPYTEWYMRDNGFNEMRVCGQWKKLASHALEKGFEGLRAVADTSWMEKSIFRDFSDYEHNINILISGMPFTAICLYDADKVDIFEIAKIIKNHSYILVRYGNDLEVIFNEELNSVMEYDRIKNEFFSNISHEFKTPLNIILAAVQLLESQGDSIYRGMNESKYLRIMQKNCYRLLRLVNNLIDIAKIDSNYYEINPQNHNIIEIIKGITASVAEYTANRGIDIVFDTNVEEKIIACDPEQIERIILNLLSNAIKFTQRGGRVWVKVFAQEDSLEISVKDTGIGIPPDKQNSIFNRFHQVDKSLTRQQEGSGIGLSLVKALVEKHGGRISLNSELGKGTEFIIKMPCITFIELENESGIRPKSDSNNYINRINIEFSDIIREWK